MSFILRVEVKIFEKQLPKVPLVSGFPYVQVTIKSFYTFQIQIYFMLSKPKGENVQYFYLIIYVWGGQWGKKGDIYNTFSNKDFFKKWVIKIIVW